MFIRLQLRSSFAVLSFTLLLTLTAFAQFTGNIQGVVTDPSGAAIAQAKLTLVNTGTQVTSSTTSDTSGNYRFVSLAPGKYKITVEASGFAKSEAAVPLLTDQNLAVPIVLKVGAFSEAVNVSAEAPLVNTAETRNQLTLETQTLA